MKKMLFGLLLAGTVGMLFSLSLQGAKQEEKKAEGKTYSSKDGFVVHEWGVICRCMEKGEWKALTMPADVPEFTQKFSGVIPKRPILDCAAKPIIYFYGDKDLKFDVEVTCNHGNPLYAWPACQATNGSKTIGIEDTKGNPQGKIPETDDEDEAKAAQFNFEFKAVARAAVLEGEDIFANWKMTWKDVAISRVGGKDLAKVPEDHWFQTARDVDAPGLTQGGTSEKFIFYEADSSQVYSNLSIKKTADGIGYINYHPNSVNNFFALKIEKGDHFIAYLPQIEKLNGKRQDWKEVKWEKVEEGDWEKLTHERLVQSLEEAGLYTKEAKGMAAIWKRDFFEKEGTRVIYRMDQQEYDQIYPLKISQKADSTVRVMLICTEIQ